MSDYYSLENMQDRWEQRQDSATLEAIWMGTAPECTCGHPASSHGLYRCYYMLTAANGYKPTCSCTGYQEPESEDDDERE